jgi:hypothetical protein
MKKFGINCQWWSELFFVRHLSFFNWKAAQDPKEIFTDPQHCSESGSTVQQATLPLPAPIAVLFPPAGWRPP